MIRNGFLPPSERRELEACVRSQREDHGVARRANAILLLDEALLHKSESDRRSPFPRRIHSMGSVLGMPSAV